MKRAFTMIELVFTMVILSIVAMVATDLIAKTYISYNQTESEHKANLKVEIALNSIANRLSYAVGGTVVKRDLDDNNKSIATTQIAPIEQAPTNYEVLEWIGYDVDGFNASEAPLQAGFALAPAWSGFCDVYASNKMAIVTPGSDLDLESKIIANLSRGDIPSSDKLKNVALFFPGNYGFDSVGYWNGGHDTSGIAMVDNYTIPTPTTATFNLKDNPSLPPNTGIARVTEHYKLAWSAYAVVPVNFRKDATGNGEDIFDLKLIYNFRPWVGNDNDYNKYINMRGHNSLLVTNVTVFKTYATENRIHIKLCVKEMFNATKKTSICKERVLLRW